MREVYSPIEVAAKGARQEKHLAMWGAIHSLESAVMTAENLHARITGTPQGERPKDVEPDPSLLQILDVGEQRIMASVDELRKCLAAIESALF